VVKGICCGLIFILMLLVTTVPSMIVEVKVKCLKDNIFDWTETPNQFFQ